MAPKILALLLLVVTMSVLGADKQIWTPRPQFRFEGLDNDEKTLIWISGFGYALTETARETAKRGSGLYCISSGRFIDSKYILSILNKEFQAKTISPERASHVLLMHVVEDFPCK
jgi:hypothetical protein